MKKKTAKELLAEELFGTAPIQDPSTSSSAIDEAFSDAALMGELGIQLDPNVADEIGAELISAADLELIQP